MNRREFLQCAAILASGVSISQVGFTLSQEQQVYLATAPNYNLGKGNYFTPAQRQIVAAMAEAIIPRTDTPGAIDAGVPNFIELMVGDWFNEQEQGIFKAGLADIETRIPAEYGKPFDQLESKEQVKILEALESAASDSSWYDFGNAMREFVSDAPFICQVKELTIFGFFTSEAGATQVLRYDGMPMRFDGDIPLSRDDSSWSSTAF